MYLCTILHLITRIQEVLTHNFILPKKKKTFDDVQVSYDLVYTVWMMCKYHMRIIKTPALILVYTTIRLYVNEKTITWEDMCIHIKLTPKAVTIIHYLWGGVVRMTSDKTFINRNVQSSSIQNRKPRKLSSSSSSSSSSSLLIKAIQINSKNKIQTRFVLHFHIQTFQRV